MITVEDGNIVWRRDGEEDYVFTPNNEPGSIDKGWFCERYMPPEDWSDFYDELHYAPSAILEMMGISRCDGWMDGS